MTKMCKKCTIYKESGDFSRALSNKDNLASTCKACVSLRNKLYWRTPVGRISQIYAAQVECTKQRLHDRPTYTRADLLAWAMNNDFTALMTNWIDSDYQKDLIPSVDRLDSNKSYTLENIRLVTWKENNDKAYTDRKTCLHVTKQCKRIEQLTLSGEHIAYFDSVAMAARVSGGVRTNINRMCAGALHIKSVKGFLWRYA